MDQAEKVARSLRAGGGRGTALHLDVRSEGQAGDAIPQVVSRFDRLDILVNNAGTDLTVPISELSVADWDRILAVNLRGPFILSSSHWPR
jgi:NAD(P)-dependent dehydrogenase (short-subunit alcohol dehydrogenase family)